MIVAGPTSNLILGAVTYVVGLIFPINILRIAANLNLSLAVFNLLPIPPLDGEKIVVTLGLSYLSQRRIYRGLSVLLLALGVGSVFSAFAFDTPRFVIRWSPYMLIGAVHAFQLSRKTDADMVKDMEKYEEAIANERAFVKQQAAPKPGMQ
jgi:Zn-dependent protease